MTSNPDVSIIIVSYNTAEQTLDCLESLNRFRSDKPCEVILVDNSSTDDTVSLVRDKHPDITVVVNEKNIGFGRANNVGAQHAKGDYLFFLNSDTVLLEDSITVLKAVLEHRPQAAGIGCRLVLPDGTIQPSAANFPNLVRIVAGREVVSSFVKKYFEKLADKITFFLPPQDLTTPRRVDWCIGAALMVRKSAFLSVGGFDPRIFLYGEEMDLCLTLAKAGWEIWYTPETTIFHLEAASSGQVLNSKRLAYIAAGHRYFYLKHKGWFGRIYCVIEAGISVVKGAIWSGCGFLTSGILRERFVKKAKWHWLYLRNYLAISY